jgi:hypothetical protein
MPQRRMAAVVDMPAADRMAAVTENVNHWLPNQAAGWKTSGGAYLLRRFAFQDDYGRTVFERKRTRANPKSEWHYLSCLIRGKVL